MDSNVPPRASRTNSSDDNDSQSSVPTAVRRIIALVIILLAAFLILLLARWIYHKVSDKSEPPVKPVEQTVQRDKIQFKDETPPVAVNNPTQVPNSGPGNVVAIFTASSLAAAGIHYIISLRRFNKSGI